MATSAHAIQINDKWFDIEEVQTGVGIKKDRVTSEFTAVDGNKRVYKSPTSMREWGLSFPEDSTPDLVDLLQLAANGKGGSVRFFDYTEAQINMLDPTKTTGPDTNPMLNVGPSAVPLPSLTNGVAYTFTNLVRGSKAAILTMWTSGAAAAVIGTYNSGAGVTNIVAPAGSGSRIVTVPFAPAANYLFTCTLAAASQTTAVRLVEGVAADTGTWLDGRSMPCAAVVADAAQTLRVAGTSGAHAQSGFAFTVSEVSPW